MPTGCPQMGIGAAAAGVTYLVGSLIGVAVTGVSAGRGERRPRPAPQDEGWIPAHGRTARSTATAPTSTASTRCSCAPPARSASAFRGPAATWTRRDRLDLGWHAPRGIVGPDGVTCWSATCRWAARGATPVRRWDLVAFGRPDLDPSGDRADRHDGSLVRFERVGLHRCRTTTVSDSSSCSDQLSPRTVAPPTRFETTSTERPAGARRPLPAPAQAEEPVLKGAAVERPARARWNGVGGAAPGAPPPREASGPCRPQSETRNVMSDGARSRRRMLPLRSRGSCQAPGAARRRRGHVSWCSRPCPTRRGRSSPAAQPRAALEPDRSRGWSPVASITTHASALPTAAGP